MKGLRILEGIVPGTISVYRLAAMPTILQHTIIYVLGRKYAKIRTSMLQDIDKGVKTEATKFTVRLSRLQKKRKKSRRF
ncbi:MAG: hypothetical protein U1F27_00290 [Turneriella sp.]